MLTRRRSENTSIFLLQGNIDLNIFKLSLDSHNHQGLHCVAGKSSSETQKGTKGTTDGDRRRPTETDGDRSEAPAEATSISTPILTLFGPQETEVTGVTRSGRLDIG